MHQLLCISKLQKRRSILSLGSSNSICTYRPELRLVIYEISAFARVNPDILSTCTGLCCSVHLRPGAILVTSDSPGASLAMADSQFGTSTRPFSEARTSRARCGDRTDGRRQSIALPTPVTSGVVAQAFIWKSVRLTRWPPQSDMIVCKLCDWTGTRQVQISQPPSPCRSCIHPAGSTPVCTAG